MATFTLNATVRGASHVKAKTRCQDYSLCYRDEENDITIALVADGHGDAKCYRSDIGAWLACEVAKASLIDFTRNISSPIRKCELGGRMRQLFSSIVVGWQNGIAYDGGLPLEVYGCTLIGYLQTKDYWLAFQIGDGKFLVRRPSGDGFEMPVPWDDDCFSNVTTSLCSNYTVDRFRYYYEEGRRSCVFLGSDGIDDTFGDGEGLQRFYRHVLNSLIEDGVKSVKRQLPRVLAHYSQVGSHDDMSLAAVLNI